MKKIGSMEFNSLIWFLTRGAFIGITLSSLIYISKRDSWISGLVALILGLIPIAIFAYIRHYDEKFNICDLNEHLFGKFGKILNIILATGAFIFIEMAFLNLVHFIYSQFLYRTDPIIIAIVFIVPLIYGLLKGINAISRTSLILFYLIIITIIFIISGVLNGVELNNLLPILETNTNSIIHGTLIIIAYNTLPLFMLQIIPKKQLENYNLKKSVIFYAIAILTLVNAAFLTIGTFGVELSLLYEYPEFHLLKKLQIGNFVDRAESILSMEWIISLFVLILMGMYYITKSISQTFKVTKKTNNIIIIIACLLLLTVSQFIFKTNGSATYFFTHDLYIIMFVIFFFIPILIALACKLNKSRCQNNPSRNNN